MSRKRTSKYIVAGLGVALMTTIGFAPQESSAMARKLLKKITILRTVVSHRMESGWGARKPEIQNAKVRIIMKERRNRTQVKGTALVNYTINEWNGPELSDITLRLRFRSNGVISHTGSIMLDVTGTATNYGEEYTPTFHQEAFLRERDDGSYILHFKERNAPGTSEFTHMFFQIFLR